MTTPYQDHLRGAADVCNNCFALTKVERVDPTRGGIAREYEQTLQRNPETTKVDYGPAEAMSEMKGVWCDCGVEDARTRIWDDADVDTERFRSLLQAMLATLDAKGVTVDRQRTAAHALQARRDGAAVDEALRAGLDHGLAVAATQPSQRPTAD